MSNTKIDFINIFSIIKAADLRTLFNINKSDIIYIPFHTMVHDVRYTSVLLNCNELSFPRLQIIFNTVEQIELTKKYKTSTKSPINWKYFENND